MIYASILKPIKNSIISISKRRPISLKPREFKMWISHSGEQRIYYNCCEKFFATSEWKAQQSVTLMDYTDVWDISAQHGDMEISASLLWPWKEAPCALPWAAPSLSSAPPVNGCEREHLDRFDRPTLRRKWSSANLFLTKKNTKKQENCHHAPSWDEMDPSW